MDSKHQTDSPAIILSVSSHSANDRLNQVETLSALSLKKPSTDVLIIGDLDSSLGIEETRSLKQFFTTTPASDYKVAVLLFAENLTLPAQNSLLRLLEEPPSFAQIFLVTANPYSLLPTIRSRCQHHFAPNTQSSPSTLPNFNDLSSAGSRLFASDQCSSRQTGLDLVVSCINHFRAQLKNNPNPSALYNLTLSLFTRNLLLKNINPKLALDYFFLHLKPLK